MYQEETKMKSKKIKKENIILNEPFNGEEIMLGGLSNTPLTTPLNIKSNVCIDYLKIRFNHTFWPDEKYFSKLLTLLGVSKDIFDTDRHVVNYERTYVFDANVYIYTGGLTTQSGGNDTTILELKGQACREFEARNCSWIDLFDEIRNLRGTCKRIDVAYDDFGNRIPRNALLQRSYKKFYTSDWKKEPYYEISPDDGFSITYGKYSQKTLCIYNKVAERKGKGYEVDRTDWMRYECRFKSEVIDESGQGVGDIAFNEVYCALVDDSLDCCAKKLLLGLIEFKEFNNEDESHQYRAPIWDVWKNFCNVDERFKCHMQYKIETSIVKKVDWYQRSAMRNRIIIELLNPKKYKDIDGYFVYHFLNKLKNRDIASINYLFQTLNIPKVKLNDVRDFLEEKYRINADGNNFTDYITGKSDVNGICCEFQNDKDNFSVGKFCSTVKGRCKILYVEKDTKMILIIYLKNKNTEWVNIKDLISLEDK